MQMHVIVRIHVIQQKARLLKDQKLRANLCRQLPPHARPKEKVQTGADKTGRKLTPAVHQIGDLARWQDRTSFDQHEMEPYLQRRQSLGPLDCISCRCPTNHETGGGENSASMGFFYGFVYRDGETEVVTGDDELSHKFLSRATMRPSRVRTNSLSRQIVVGFIKAASKETTAARSRNGRSIKLLNPSRSRSPHPRITAIVTRRRARAPARTDSPSGSPSLAAAKRSANGTGRMR